MPFTVRVCVVDRDILCSQLTYKRCRPGRSCTNTVHTGQQSGASHPEWIRLATISLKLDGVAPRELEGDAVTVTIKSRSQTKTKTAEFDYYRGGECCGDQSFADVRFWFPRPDQHHKS